jgi:hypothetical protein
VISGTGLAFPETEIEIPSMSVHDWISLFATEGETAKVKTELLLPCG